MMLLKNTKEKLIFGIIAISTIMTIGILCWIFFFVIKNGIAHITPEFLLSSHSNGEEGIFPMIINTLVMIGVTIAIAVPVGISSAIYLVEYAKQGKMVRLIRFATESLAGIPSIIYGLFGMIFFVTILGFSWSIWSGSLTLSIMVLPTIIRTTEESLKSVPNEYREGSLGLGASKIRTITKIILPTALPGIVTAVILSVGRVIGETAAVYLTAGMTPRIARSIMESGRTLSVHMYLLAKEGISFEQAYATATVLLITVFLLNLMAKGISRKIRN
jgi:phosphate transport system permease protein